MLKIYYVIVNHGDGYSGVEWFKSPPDLETMQNEEPEFYGMTEDYYSLTLPVDTDLDSLGVRFSD